MLRYDAALLDRPQLVAATKRDAVADDDPLPALRAKRPQLGLRLVPISAVTGAGLVGTEARDPGARAANREAAVVHAEHA